MRLVKQQALALDEADHHQADHGPEDRGAGIGEQQESAAADQDGSQGQLQSLRHIGVDGEAEDDHEHQVAAEGVGLVERAGHPQEATLCLGARFPDQIPERGEDEREDR